MPFALSAPLRLKKGSSIVIESKSYLYLSGGKGVGIDRDNVFLLVELFNLL
jgi:hypothetical protein